MGTELEPVMSKRESLAKCLAYKAEAVRMPVVKLDIYRYILEVEKTIRFRIQKEELDAKSST